MFFQVPTQQPPAQPDTLFTIHGWPVTNAMLLGVLITFFLLLIGIVIKKRATTSLPTRFLSLAEILVEGMLTLVEQITGSRVLAEKIFPLIGTIFVFCKCA